MVTAGRKAGNVEVRSVFASSCISSLILFQLSRYVPTASYSDKTVTF